MKLRLHGETLRFRLSQSEVARLGAGERVEDVIAFADQQTLKYAIGPGATLRATFDGGGITVTVPSAQLKNWAESGDVSISSADGPLKLLIEKDFQCLHGPEADGPGLFPNPGRPPD